MEKTIEEKNIIEAKNLTKYYGKHLALNKVNLQVYEGEIFAFLGPNGAGKSTFIRILLGLINKTDGSLKAFNLESKPSNLELLDKVGYLASESNFYKNEKVKDIIELTAKIEKVSSLNYAFELANRLELDLNKKISDLSLGNRKKLGIVCALLKKPKLIILDEPTSGLDPYIQHLFWEELLSLKKQGTTIFLSSHTLSEVQHYCDRVAFIKNGQIVKVASMDEIKRDFPKKVFIKGIKNIEEIKRISELEASAHGIIFYYKGDINILTRHLSQYDLQDLTIRDASLEEVFMNFYL